ncbi:Leucine-, glutamate- and lysine-rich protein 1 [Platysternon megacephalum]|uniref:Leucine-, glutamate-and lysine-rich protein 1 n=1 Tax=Platysternon megacephalum TaxID=55544 RepID=A0A4D9EVH0_9SAUR|nr:Leucine-, glutamate- and lysine-rich protein 1 [Platysternon megacephalum]
MSRDETVCKYCGVSYLILHEFKLMEDKVKAMEKEMKFYEGSVEREKRLQAQLQCLSRDFEQCTADSESKTERINNLTVQLKDKQNELQNLNEALRCFQEEKEVAYKKLQLFRKRLENHRLTLNKTLSLLPFIRRELVSIKEVASNKLDNCTVLREEIFLQIKTISKDASTEVSRLNQRLSEFQRDKVSLQEEVKHLKLVSDAVELKSQQLQTSLQQENELQNRCHELQKETLDLTNQVETIGLKFQKATAEMGHYKKLLMMKSKEVDICQSELQKLEYENGMSKSRLTKDLKEKEESLLVCQQVCKRLQEEVAEKERQEEDLKRRTSCSESELETIKTLLRQREEEVVMLKQESVLFKKKKSFKSTCLNKLQKLKSKNFQKFMEIGLAKHQARHTEEIFRLKEDARMELDIERQKHQELIAKYQNDQEELQMKIPELISSAINSLRMEVGILKNQLQEAQIKLTEKDGDKEEEMRSLKRLVTKLEFQLKKEQNNSDSLSEGMRKEIKEKSDELEKLTQEQAELIQNLSQAQEENSLLQETVRRECEERYELTEALTQAREQVLELKRLSGNFPLSQCSLSQGSLTSCAALVSNHGQKSLTSSNSGKGITHSGLCGISRAANAPAFNKHKSSGKVGLPALTPPHPPRGRASSVNESKNRITAVIRRQLSQL